MQPITLHIPRIWRSDKVINTTHPDNWEELKPSQFIALVRVINADISEDDLLVEMLDLPLNVIKKLDTFQRYRLGQLLDFMQSKAPFNRFIITEVNGFKAPTEGLTDVSFGEFIHMDTFFIDYQTSNKNSDLLNLIACVYVAHKAGKRPEFSGIIDVSPFNDIKRARREAIALNYGLIRTWLEQAYPEVFPQQTAASGENKKTGNGWVDVYDSIVGDDLINGEKYYNMPCHEVLRYMNRKIIENRKNKK